MIDKILGDTIVFEANVIGTSGSAVTDAVANLVVVDALGSTVLSTTAGHTSNGTYQKVAAIVGWNKGPITEYWKFTNGAGTTSQVNSNGFRVIGTDTIQPYIFSDELPSYHENVVDYFDGNEDAQVVDAFNEINARLEGMGYKLPFRVKDDGFYDQPLRDLNAYEAILRIVSKRQQSFDRSGDKEPWFMAFRKEADRIYKNISNKVYNFSRDISVGEAGVGIATKVAGGTRAQMDTNWRGGVGSGFQDDSYERDWVVTVVGTGTAGEIGECSFTWSNNGGVSVIGTRTTGLDWQELGSGVYVRFHRGTYTGGTVNLFAVNDQWNFKTYPKTQAVGGKKSARSY